MTTGSPTTTSRRDGADGQPSISVIVSSERSAADLDRCLRALIPQAQQRSAEVVVVRPADRETIRDLETMFPTVRFVEAPPGADGGDLRTFALGDIAADVVLFTDDHDAVPEGWIPVYDPDAVPPRAEVVTAAAPPKRSVAPLRDGDHVVVIGGGPGGLTPAYLLAKRGVRVTVFEATDAVGGISQTAEYKGYRFDIGGHRFFTKYPPVQALWEEILGDEFISVPRLSRIYYNGRFFDYPLKAANALRGLGIVNAVLILASYLKAHFRPNPIEENFEQWVSNRFGKRLYEIFFKTYTEKVWGISCTEIRAEWAAQRIQGLSLAKAILSAASLNKRSTKIKTLINEFQYPRLGPGQMWEKCRDRIEEMGGEVLMEHKVTAIEVEGDRIVAVRASGPRGEIRVAGDHFFSTMPLRNLVRSLHPAAPAPVQAAGEGLRYRDFLTVALIIDDPNLFPDNWIYIHSTGVRVGRIQNFNNWSRALVPNPGHTCLGLEYFCFEGDGLWTSDDADLVALAKKEIGELGLVDPAKVVEGTVIRMPKAYPIYDGEYRDHLDTIRTHIDAIRNLHPVGRNGMHKYNNQDHSMLTAMMSMWNMLGADHDVWEVNTDFEYHEEIRLEEPDPGASTESPAEVATG